MKNAFVAVAFIFLISCSSNNAESPATNSPPPNQQQITNKDKDPDQSKDSSPEPDESGPNDDSNDDDGGGNDSAPCCSADGNIHFEGVDLHATYTGLDSSPKPLKEYQVLLKIKGDTEAMSKNQLLVKASMPGMHHVSEFAIEKISPQEYTIGPVVFGMAGKWDVSFAILDANNEKIDDCTCKMEIGEK